MKNLKTHCAFLYRNGMVKKHSLKFFVLILVLLLTFVGMMSQSLWALEPPRPGEIEELKRLGLYEARYEYVKRIGNHKFDPALVQKSIIKLRRMLQEAEGRAPGEDSLEQPVPPTSRQRMPTTGYVKVFTILIAFNDYPYSNSPDSIHNGIFGPGESGRSPYESVAVYYDRSSYNLLDLSGGHTFDWYTTAYNRSEVIETDEGREDLIKEVLDYLDAEGHDFSEYDNDGDGDIDYFIVLWTGPETGWASFWWGWKHSFHDSTYTLDGKTLSQYSWQWEADPPGSTFHPKVVIHETGHALGLPDYYDHYPDIGPKGGVGKLDMMDGNKGDHNCFSKWMLDWIYPKFVAFGSRTLTLRASGEYPDAVMIMPMASSDDLFTEYFMAQNRHRVGNDDAPFMPGDGMLIWHIDARLNAWKTDFLYNNSATEHKLLRLMEADGLEEIETGDGWADAGDYYRLGDEFGPETMPNSNRYDGTITNVSVTDITDPGPTMTATFSVLKQIWHVDGDVVASGDGRSWATAFKTIQEAVEAANHKDEIWVKKGTYYLTSEIDTDRGVYLYAGYNGTETARDQRDWQTNVTTVDGQNIVRCFNVTSALFATIDGFAIVNGRPGIRTVEADLDVYNCTFSSNSSYTGGGAMRLDGGDVIIEGSTFTGNETTIGADGGAIYLDGTDLIIRDSTFSGNESAQFGGAIANYSGDLTIERCTFSGNNASMDGGAIFNWYGDASIRNSTFTGNTGDPGTILNYYGYQTIQNSIFYNNQGGAIVNSHTSPTITNCTFSGNHADFGGAVYNYDASPTITNCILWGDTSVSGGPEIYDSSGSLSVVSYSDINQNGYAGSNGNIRDDPLFVGGGDLHLQPGSLCIDAGNNAAASGSTDIDGDPRILEGNGDGIARVDMGADEYVPVADWYVDGDVSSSGDGRSWATAFKTVEEAIDAIRAINWFDQKWRYEIWVKRGTYSFSSTLVLDVADIKAWVMLYGGFDGTEVYREQRDWRANETIVDGMNSVRCFHVDGIAFTLNGFTVRNGMGWYAGGVRIMDYAIAHIANCTFSGHNGDYGGAVYTANSTLTVWNTIFTGNLAGDDREGGGGGIYNNRSALYVTNSIFFGNQAEDGADGGAIYNDNASSDPEIINCTFYGNSAHGEGGAIYNKISYPIVANSILWGDSASSYPEIYETPGSTEIVGWCDIDQDGYAGSSGNIRQDPMFVDPASGDFHLQPGSPCIDAGLSTGAPEEDMEGNPRYDDPDTPNTGAGTYPYYDMGAHEYMPIFDGDIDWDGNVDGKDLSIFAGAFGSVLGDSNYNPGADFNEDNGVDEDDLAIFAQNFGKTN